MGQSIEMDRAGAIRAGGETLLGFDNIRRVQGRRGENSHARVASRLASRTHLTWTRTFIHLRVIPASRPSFFMIASWPFSALSSA